MPPHVIGILCWLWNQIPVPFLKKKTNYPQPHGETVFCPSFFPSILPSLISPSLPLPSSHFPLSPSPPSLPLSFLLLTGELENLLTKNHKGILPLDGHILAILGWNQSPDVIPKADKDIVKADETYKVQMLPQMSHAQRENVEFFGRHFVLMLSLSKTTKFHFK